jgi:hypothetical protein
VNEAATHPLIKEHFSLSFDVFFVDLGKKESFTQLGDLELDIDF